ncbi:MAG: pyrimidine 5'-nucleotidase [Proteobacteria bacterium]|nr:pyrimidine 5'-nucleotidase [Pseudomonadota bacterium]
MQKRTTMKSPLHETDCWIFDLDNTLYPASCDLFSQIDVRMGSFISDLLGVDRIEARRIQKQYYYEHGTTLAGLMANEGVHPDTFLEFVHDIDVTPVPPSPALLDALSQLPGRCIVYTNGSRRHAENVMARLGVSNAFTGIYDIIASGYRPKPSPEPYADMIRQFDINPARAVMFEDIHRNLKPAHDLGMGTVLIRTERHPPDLDDDDHIHHVADDLLAWLQAILAEEPA